MSFSGLLKKLHLPLQVSFLNKVVKVWIIVIILEKRNPKWLSPRMHMLLLQGWPQRTTQTLSSASLCSCIRLESFDQGKHPGSSRSEWLKIVFYFKNCSLQQAAASCSKLDSNVRPIRNRTPHERSFGYELNKYNERKEGQSRNSTIGNSACSGDAVPENWYSVRWNI